MKAALLFGLCAAAFAQPSVERDRHWREDLDYFAQHFSKGHCTPAELFHNPLTALQPCHHADFEKLYPQPAFDNEIAAIKEAVPGLSDSAIILRLMRLIASGNVSHTYLGMPLLKFGFTILPLSFRWYSDGLAVVSATPRYSDALGAHVIRIGSKTSEEVIAALSPYIGHENENWLHIMAPGHLKQIPIVQQIGAANADGSVEFTLAKPGGAPFTVAVKARDPRVKEVNMFDEMKIPAGLYRKHINSYYWYEYLADSRTLYVQDNRCENDPKQSFGDFTHAMFASTDRQAVDRVIVDLRWNGGGNSMIVSSLKRGLKDRPNLRSHVFVIIGRGTFSSAQDAAIEFRRELGATLVGEGTGEKLNSYGEVRQLTLPNSKLRVQYATEFFRMDKTSDAAALEPDIAAPYALADALAGRDPALDAALHAQPRPLR